MSMFYVRLFMSLSQRGLVYTIMLKYRRYSFMSGTKYVLMSLSKGISLHHAVEIVLSPCLQIDLY